MSPTVDQRDETLNNAGAQSLPNGSREKTRPVTIRQLLDAKRDHSEAPFKIDDHEINRISLVAHAVDVHRYESTVVYTLEDGTSLGRIDARHYPTGSSFEELSDSDQGTSQLYVHVLGTLDLKVKLGSRNVIRVLHMYRVTDPNQLFFHILEAAFVTLSLERGPPPAAALKSAAPRIPTEPASPVIRRTAPSVSPLPRTPVKASVPAPGPSRRVLTARTAEPGPATPSTTRPSAPSTPTSWTPTPLASARRATPARQARPPSPPPTPPPRSPSPEPPSSPPPASPQERVQKPSKSKRRQPGIKQDPYADLTVLQRSIILQLMKATHSKAGMNVDAICHAVGHHYSTQQDVSGAIDVLLDLGLIENTIDEAHYAVKTIQYPRSP
ncbi:hypothetical protein BD309DRAFT_1013742 [Dichomitus squalens]|uniref:Replication protein A C-terminal domain-containing protein n=1 Tax=Dichomitus squalens TaxID=114155 RepID=A0A4Q9N774_9APHY|nr:uncharacterized protein DICSQDRAFT_165568 [Dichomitus squalens LYAD-421 SS1]EJF65866.1 hypothetical protein DICSQDRAFT_165568 [Dichomitus squalens LYAD-421 SS1]TBU35967.1 hypothetical protein BD311DRAFT_647432 [Dichomitus squalens]TBU50792.1 hypothetical protein BD309DRAFT_1013742 [Dichomitus squalens]